jgi:hypothetical protein
VLETGTVAPRHTLRWTRPPLAREGGLEDWDRCSVQTVRGAWPECVPSTTVIRLASSRKGGHFSGPVWPPGHDEPGPLHNKL